ncbi:hypothetical protein POM88_049459 [Heracleum sosnowskyi]|uniref:Protein kinase domain-containing protein n=1 Tax=Heracleum sosnowskyi TaxID=360622 RepID=A0AAD8GY84_9APIA|nr:hypothetical protein POM88_049459 [Heracleum sosnowskyi]
MDVVIALECLAAAHECCGLLLDYLKPENLLLDSSGTLKVSDFGLSALSQQLRLSVSLSAVSPKQLPKLKAIYNVKNMGLMQMWKLFPTKGIKSLEQKEESAFMCCLQVHEEYKLEAEFPSLRK